MTLKIMSYNIHSGVGVDGVQDYDRIGRFLAEQGADVVLLQEVDTRSLPGFPEEHMEALCAGDHFRLLPSPAVYTSDGWFGNGVLTRFPAVFSQSIDVSQVGRQPRNIQEVIVNTDEGLLYLLNTHKGLRAIERREQINRLGRHLQNARAIPTVVGGDFNEWQLLSPRLHKLNEILVPLALSATFPTAWPVFRLDRFWVDPGTMVMSTQVVKTAESRVYSDHYPIELVIDLSAVTTRNPEKAFA